LQIYWEILYLTSGFLSRLRTMRRALILNLMSRFLRLLIASKWPEKYRDPKYRTTIWWANLPVKSQSSLRCHSVLEKFNF